MRFVLMLVAAIAVLAALASLVPAIVGFLAAQHACPGNDCYDAVSTGLFGVMVATVSGGIAATCIHLVRRHDAARIER